MLGRLPLTPSDEAVEAIAQDHGWNDEFMVVCRANLPIQMSRLRPVPGNHEVPNMFRNQVSKASGAASSPESSSGGAASAWACDAFEISSCPCCDWTCEPVACDSVKVACLLLQLLWARGLLMSPPLLRILSRFRSWKDVERLKIELQLELHLRLAVTSRCAPSEYFSTIPCLLQGSLR